MPLNELPSNQPTVSQPTLSQRTREEARAIIARYPQPRSALLPMLHLVQSEQGQVTTEGVALCAEELDLSMAEVGAVATFYTMFKRKPTGEYLVSVCTNTLCGMLGGDEIFASLEEYLGIGNNDTTEDGAVTIEHAECLAACDFAPVMTVNYEFFDNATVESATAVVDALRGGRRPQPTRGAPLCTFRQIERQLAGFDVADDPDARTADVRAESAGEPTLVGVKMAADRGEGAPSYDPHSPIPAAEGSK